MILFFDTETTGFPNTTKPRDHVDQPHIVELAAELCEDSGKTVMALSVIIDPGVERGIRIPSKVVEIHGIDEEKCWRYGVHPEWALDHFLAMLSRADVVAAHNLDFDFEMMSILAARMKGGEYENPWPRPFCTMKAAEPILKLPKANGRSGYKWPNLGECTRHFLGREHANAHSAWPDMQACKEIYFKLNPPETIIRPFEAPKPAPSPEAAAPKSVWDQP